MKHQEELFIAKTLFLKKMFEEVSKEKDAAAKKLIAASSVKGDKRYTFHHIAWISAENAVRQLYDTYL